MGMRREMLVSDRWAGIRLDRVLEEILPELGLRGRRRMIQEGLVRVDGLLRPMAYKLRTGQNVTVEPKADVSEHLSATGKVRVVSRCGAFVALAKPSGLHSAALAGGGGPSVEALLPSLFPGQSAQLLNRLDWGTSGLLLVGFGAAAATWFREQEAHGKVDKEYAAVVGGTVSETGVTWRRALDMARRRRTRVMSSDDPDPARWTHLLKATPVVLSAVASHDSLALVRVRIGRGARHQIRVHLAAAGHPIVGDTFYGGSPAERLYLHHEHLVFPLEDGERFEAVWPHGWPVSME